MSNYFILIIISIAVRVNHAANDSFEFELPIYFPNNRPHKPDLYLCTSILLSNFSSGSLYIKGFNPIAEMSVVHHMLLYGCIKPGRSKLWNCGAMLGQIDNLPMDSICSEGMPRILYAWARNAPRLQLPENVGFQVGGDTGIQSLVLQYHTGPGDHDHQGQQHIMKTGNNDLMKIGVVLHVSSKPTPKLAGVYWMGSYGVIPPKMKVHLEIGCIFKENKEIHPFAFRTHSHSLGKVISGYRVRRSMKGQGQMEWRLIGKKDPQLPQMFYSVENPDEFVVKRGDILAARCTMESNRTRTTYIGETAEDEMCNFYIMYYVNGGNILENPQCYNHGPIIEDFWRRGPLGLNNFPVDASNL